jgi:hypothetical protein
MTTKWLPKPQVRARYSMGCDKTLERAVQQGRLPEPQYHFQNRIPAWRESELDEHDAKVIRGPIPVTARPLKARPKRDEGGDGGSVTA